MLAVGETQKQEEPVFKAGTVNRKHLFVGRSYQ